MRRRLGAGAGAAGGPGRLQLEVLAVCLYHKAAAGGRCGSCGRAWTAARCGARCPCGGDEGRRERGGGGGGGTLGLAAAARGAAPANEELLFAGDCLAWPCPLIVVRGLTAARRRRDGDACREKGRERGGRGGRGGERRSDSSPQSPAERGPRRPTAGHTGPGLWAELWPDHSMARIAPRGAGAAQRGEIRFMTGAGGGGGTARAGGGGGGGEGGAGGGGGAAGAADGGP